MVSGSDAAERPEELRYSVPQAARLLGISERGVRARIEAGTLRGEKQGKAWVVALDAVEGADESLASGSVPADAVTIALLDRIRELEAKNEALAHRNGYLEAQLETQKLLEDKQSKRRGFWQRLWGTE